LLPLTPHTVNPAFEDGTDTGFQNVGQLQFDAGEIPRRKYTTPVAAVTVDSAPEDGRKGCPKHVEHTCSF